MAEPLNIPEEAIEGATDALVDRVDTDRGYLHDDAEAALTAAAPLILAAERERILPQLEFLFEHAESFDVPKALRCILAGDWPYPARARELRGEV